MNEQAVLKDGFCTLRQASKELGVSFGALKMYVWLHDIPKHYVGNVVIVNRRDLAGYVPTAVGRNIEPMRREGVNSSDAELMSSVEVRRLAVLLALRERNVTPVTPSTVTIQPNDIFAKDLCETLGSLTQFQELIKEVKECIHGTSIITCISEIERGTIKPRSSSMIEAATFWKSKARNESRPSKTGFFVVADEKPFVEPGQQRPRGCSIAPIQKNTKLSE